MLYSDSSEIYDPGLPCNNYYYIHKRLKLLITYVTPYSKQNYKVFVIICKHIKVN